MRLIIGLFLIVWLQGAMAQAPLTLEQCLAKAQSANLNVRDAMLNAELADEASDQSRWNLLPTLNGAATHGYNWGKTIDQYTNTFASSRVRTNNLYLSSDVVLFQGGALRQRIKQADVNRKAAGSALQAARDNVAVAVVRAFLDLVGTREQVAAAAEQAAATRAQVQVTGEMVQAGRVARADLLEVQAQAAQEEYNLENLRTQAESAKITLAQLMQLEPAEVEAFDIVAPGTGTMEPTAPTATVEEVLPKVLATNPFYQRAAFARESARHGTRIAKATGYPLLALGGTLGTGYSGRNLEAVGQPKPDGSILIGATSSGEPVFAPNFSQSTRVKSFGQQLDDNLNESIGLTLNIPIFNNLRNHYAIGQARIQEDLAENDLLRARNSLQVDVQNALTAQRGAFRQYISAKTALDAAQEALRMAEERFASQAATATDLTFAKSRQQQANAQLISAKYNYLMAMNVLNILQGLPVSL